MPSCEVWVGLSRKDAEELLLGIFGMSFAGSFRVLARNMQSGYI